MKYVYRLIPQNGAPSFHTSLKAIERELEIYCKLHNRTLQKEAFCQTDVLEERKVVYYANDTDGEYIEYPVDKIEPVYHTFYVERIVVHS